MNQNLEIDPREIEEASNLDAMKKAMKDIEKLKDSGYKEPYEEEEREEEQEEEAEPEEAETESDQEQEEEAPKKKEQEKIWKYRKAKYKALHEKSLLKKENDILRQDKETLENLLNQSVNSGAYLYSKGASADLARERETYKRALEEGDVEAAVDSQIEIAKAVNTLKEIERWNINNTPNVPNNKPIPNYNNNTEEESIADEIATDWLDNHPYLQPESKSYDPKLAVQVNQYVHEIDNDLKRTGREHLYFSKSYFQAIDEFIDENKNKIIRKPKNPEGMNYIGGVRSSYSSSTNKKPERTQIALTTDEKLMCDNAGIPYKLWEEKKLAQFKNSRR